MFRSTLVLLAFCASACMTEDSFYKMREESSSCGSADTCTLAGSSSCICAAPVRSSEAANIDAAARQVSCGGKMVKCQSLVNPRCEAGRCVADPG